MLVCMVILIVSVAAKKQDQWDAATDYSLFYKNETECPFGVITMKNGANVSQAQGSSALNTSLALNSYYLEIMSSLVREKTIERVVHARGAGAFGYFELTHDMSHICKADFLKEVGKKTPVAVRFSSATGERGISELNRDIRAFAVKFYTKEGNFDLTTINTPTFLTKDPMHFHLFVHAFKRHPATNLQDANALWDALTLIPESMPTYLRVLSDLGIPASYRHMPGYSVHTMQVENEVGDLNFMNVHCIPEAGILGLAQPTNITDPDYFTRDLFQGIATGNYPSWIVYAQILSESDVATEGHGVFDITRYISLNKYPLKQIGKIVLNRNPKNYYAEVEQLAFSPANLINGIHGAPDLFYQARRIAYPDAQYHRLGVNYNKIKVNSPYQVNTFSYNRDGSPPVLNNGDDIPNYPLNSFNGPVYSTIEAKRSLINIVEEKASNFDQAREFLSELPTVKQDIIIDNIVLSLQQVDEFIQERAINIFTTIDPEFGSRVAQGLNTTA